MLVRSAAGGSKIPPANFLSRDLADDLGKLAAYIFRKFRGGLLFEFGLRVKGVAPDGCSRGSRALHGRF